jgi:OOP family OmpA-OmpF porin
MEVGDLHVWVEQGPEASLAIVIRGAAPFELRHTMREVLETIHFERQRELAGFEGDTSDFAVMQPLLEECLESQAVEEERGVSPLLWGALALLAVVVGWWLVSGWRTERALASYLEALRGQPGIVVTHVDEADGATVVRGLRDPMAADPMQIASELGLDQDRVYGVFQPFVSLHEPFVLERARQTLSPPPTVRLELVDGVLRATGAASPEWILDSRRIAMAVPGVLAYSDEAVDGDDSQLLEAAQRVTDMVERIEARGVQFEVESDHVSEAQVRDLEEAAEEIRQLVEAAEVTRQEVRVLVEGHTDPSGPAEINRRLSRARAERVMALLVAGGVPAQLLQARGQDALPSRVADQEIDDGAFDRLRKVSFTVEIGERQP